MTSRAMTSLGCALIVMLVMLTGCRRRRPPVAQASPGIAASPTAGSESPPGPPVPTAEEECGTDRRCRLARLRRTRQLQRATHHAQERAEFLYVEQRRERHELDASPRRLHPWIIEALVTDHHLGAAAGLHPHPNVYFGINGAFFWGYSQYRSEVIPPVNPDDYPMYGYSSTQVNAAFVVGGELRWLMFEHIITPYLGLGFQVLLGGASTGGTSIPYQEGRLEAHYLQTAAGIDVQFPFGLRFRAAFVVRPLIHVRARSEGDAILSAAEDGFRDGFRLFGAEGGIGWSL